ncbi:hypothetical protein [Botrimarina sp.]|uniref:hypothetical protein n=1 Tax=Botrimarina sp. TaxID=2795802 RepID=UPI0032EB33F5
MAWLFERTVEAAAWAALVAGWVSLGFAVYWFYCFVATLGAEPSLAIGGGEIGGPDYGLLRDAGEAAGAFVGFSLALGGLACVDRMLFDADEPQS